ncbi:MAG: hypothetical protein LBI40_02840, partial [Treponema sp.]|nr:hypothetical protein [Treponema sp.]
DYIQPKLKQHWGYDGLCAFAAECMAEEEYVNYYYSKGLRASEIRKILSSNNYSYAEELLN